MGHLEIVEPCSEDWSAMTPAEGGRFCGRCRETVVDLSRTRRADAERRVRRGEALCAQLALDAHGRPVFAPEPPSRMAKIAVRLAVMGAVATGCGRGEGAPASSEPASLEAIEQDAALFEQDAQASEDAALHPGERLEIGSGSLLTGHGDEIPPAPPRPPVVTATNPVAPPPAVPSHPNSNHHAPPPVAPSDDEITPPPVHHLRGRVAYRP